MFLKLDLADLRAVRSAAEEFLAYVTLRLCRSILQLQCGENELARVSTLMRKSLVIERSKSYILYSQMRMSRDLPIFCAIVKN